MRPWERNPMTMTNEQAREVFDKVAATHRAQGERDKAARVEICREYFTNPTFRKALAAHLWALANQPKR